MCLSGNPPNFVFLLCVVAMWKINFLSLLSCDKSSLEYIQICTGLHNIMYLVGKSHCSFINKLISDVRFSHLLLVYGSIALYRFIYLENLVKPSEMPRPLSFTGITVHITHTKTLYIK